MMYSAKSPYGIRPKHLWKSFCFGLGALYLLSLLVLGYLKFIGEVMPFCFYDNFYYASFYFAAFLYMVVAMELSDVPISKSQARNWYSHKFLGCSVLFAEAEAFFQYLISYGQVAGELEIDTIASPYIHGLFALGLIRLLLVGAMAVFGVRKLNAVAASKGLQADEVFGSVVTFFADFTIMQLYAYTAFLYDFSLPMVLLISVVSYVYYKFARV